MITEGGGGQTNDYVIKRLLFCYIFSAILFKIAVKFILTRGGQTNDYGLIRRGGGV